MQRLTDSTALRHGMTFSLKKREMRSHVSTVKLIWLIPTRSAVMIRALAVQARSIRTAAVRRADPVKGQENILEEAFKV